MGLTDEVSGTKPAARASKLLQAGHWLPLVVLVLGLVITYSLWENEQQIIAQDLRLNFDFSVQENISLIKQRMLAYEQVLRGVRGLFSASESVGRREFHDYVSALGLEDTYPGIQGVGFSLIVPPAQKESHTESIRGEGFPGYAIKPEGVRETYSSIIYLEPFTGRNLRAFGYDMFSEKVRRVAMERARDTGKVALSGKVRLVQEDGDREQAGVLIYLPVYATGKPLDSVESRRSAIIGWVYSPFRMNDLMAGLFGRHADEMNLEIYDGTEISGKTLLYDSAGTRSDRLTAPTRHAVRRIQIAGQTWTVAFRALPPFEDQDKRGKAGDVAIVGIVLSILLTLITWLLAAARTRAVESREALAVKQKQLEDLNLSLEQRVADRTAELERLNRELESFCYSISHEIQAPIARLDGFSRAIAEAVKAGGPDDDTVYLASRLEVASQRLRHVIDSLLVMYRMGSIEIEREPVDLSELCGRILGELLANGTGRTITTTIAPGVMVQGDRRMLDTCLRLLLENAVKYSAGNPETAIEFGKTEHAGETVLFVRDNGVGFDMTYADKLFQPFSRLHNEPEFEGSGTGLPTAQRIIERHGGRIWCEAEPGLGATFFFTLA